MKTFEQLAPGDTAVVLENGSATKTVVDKVTGSEIRVQLAGTRFCRKTGYSKIGAKQILSEDEWIRFEDAKALAKFIQSDAVWVLRNEKAVRLKIKSIQDAADKLWGAPLPKARLRKTISLQGAPSTNV